MKLAVAILLAGCAPSSLYVEGEGGAAFTGGPYAALRAGVTWDLGQPRARHRRADAGVEDGGTP